MATQITILGLGQIGTSIGLALASHKAEMTRVGNDRELPVARQAERMGAFDRVSVNLHSAVENSPIIILALPVDDVIETLNVIVEDLAPGTVVLDTSPVHVAMMDTASKILGSERYFVSMTPTINPAYLNEPGVGPQAAHADLFKNSLMVITSPPGVHAGAIQLAADLTILLGGTPFYADPYEADGLTAASHTLPMLLAAALVHAAADQPGWQEGRKLAGPLFAQGTQAVNLLDGYKLVGEEAVMNRQNVVRVLDNLMTTLQVARGLVERGESEALSEYLKQAQESRETWLKQRSSSDWNTSQQQAAPSSADMLGRLVGWRPKKK